VIDKPAETAVTPEADGQEDDVRAQSVRDVLARLYADGRAYANAEMDRQKVRAGIVAAGIRNAAILGLIALMLVFGAIVALLVGLTFGLAVHVGPLWATLIVVGGALIVALLLLLLAKASITRMRERISR